MQITRVTPDTQTLSITLTKGEAEKLCLFLIDGPNWRAEGPDEPAHSGGHLAESLHDAIEEAFK